MLKFSAHLFKKFVGYLWCYTFLKEGAVYKTHQEKWINPVKPTRGLSGCRIQSWYLLSRQTTHGFQGPDPPLLEGFIVESNIFCENIESCGKPVRILVIFMYLLAVALKKNLNSVAAELGSYKERVTELQKNLIEVSVLNGLVIKR